MIQVIMVIGAGTMGHGIAAQAARYGYQVHLFDPYADSINLARQKIDKIYQIAIKKNKMTTDEVALSVQRLSFHTATSLDALASLDDFATHLDLVIEAVPEKLALKQKLLATMEQKVSDECILATNTSSLSINRIAAALQKPQRCIGLHFFNPVAVMSLLEIVTADQTSEVVAQACKAWGESVLKTPIMVKDSPGFATSRLGIALGNEAMRIYQEGVASAEDIDRAMVLGYRHPIGPLALSDLVGLDIRLAISEYLYAELGSDAFDPPQILKDKVARGECGKKSGQGFYKYSQD